MTEPAPQVAPEQATSGNGRHSRARSAASALISTIVHCTLFLVLALLASQPAARKSLSLVAAPAARETLQPGDASQFLTGSEGEPSPQPAELPSPALQDVTPVPLPPDSARSDRTQPQYDLARIFLAPRDLRAVGRHPDAGSFRGRSGDARDQLLGQRGGNEHSENAVALGLAWLAAHQHRDGGWRFDLNSPQGPCHGQCRDAGTVGTTTGATGLALLAMLGAGQTHLEGIYRDVVHDGIYYLKSHAVMTSHGADLQEGTMYAQGIATLALCEAYGMTQDADLKELAQRAVDFICYAQHSAGGWRYFPQQPGDTTVFGWQMMALKSATMAGLNVPSPVMNLAERFLDSVQVEYGAYYGYVSPEQLPAPTAIGLLVRMYTGWDQDDSRLQRGVNWLAEIGPSDTDMYFNYYATMVLCQHNGKAWPGWNQRLRDYLIRTQAMQDHERGSWFFPDRHGSRAGRVYTTAVCVMILEVYYRYLPLYGEASIDRL